MSAPNLEGSRGEPCRRVDIEEARLKAREARAFVRGTLEWLQGHEYKPLRVSPEFRRVSSECTSYVMANVSGSASQAFSLALYAGVRFVDVEEKILALKGVARNVSQSNWTVRIYTMNAGPRCRWHYPIDGVWWFRTLEELQGRVSEINDVTENLILPTIDSIQSPMSARDFLLSAPRRHTNLYSWEQVLTIDLLHDPGRVKRDLEVMLTMPWLKARRGECLEFGQRVLAEMD